MLSFTLLNVNGNVLPIANTEHYEMFKILSNHHCSRKEGYIMLSTVLVWHLDVCLCVLKEIQRHNILFKTYNLLFLNHDIQFCDQV